MFKARNDSAVIWVWPRQHGRLAMWEAGHIDIMLDGTIYGLRPDERNEADESNFAGAPEGGRVLREANLVEDGRLVSRTPEEYLKETIENVYDRARTERVRAKAGDWPVVMTVEIEVTNAQFRCLHQRVKSEVGRSLPGRYRVRPSAGSASVDNCATYVAKLLDVCGVLDFGHFSEADRIYFPPMFYKALNYLILEDPAHSSTYQGIAIQNGKWARRGLSSTQPPKDWPEIPLRRS